MRQKKTDFIKDCIVTIVSDDYESFEIIMKNIRPLMQNKGMEAIAAEVAGVLETAIAEGYADAYELTTVKPAARVAYDVTRLNELWYYATARGKAVAKGIPALSGEEDSETSV